MKNKNNITTVPAFASIIAVLIMMVSVTAMMSGCSDSGKNVPDTPPAAKNNRKGQAGSQTKNTVKPAMKTVGPSSGNNTTTQQPEVPNTVPPKTVVVEPKEPWVISVNLNVKSADTPGKREAFVTLEGKQPGTHEIHWIFTDQQINGTIDPKKSTDKIIVFVDETGKEVTVNRLPGLGNVTNVTFESPGEKKRVNLIYDLPITADGRYGLYIDFVGYLKKP